MKAGLSEIFSSLQGEGTHLGAKHIFVRFGECHIHCEYCDELDKPITDMSVDEVVAEILRLEKEEGPLNHISLTGGEPLMYLDFLKVLLPRLKQENLATYLETNGILYGALREVIDHCDVIAMDLKPASVTKERNVDAEHRAFLETAKQKECFIKIILSKELDEAEYDEQIDLVAEIAPETPVLLVPISTDVDGHEDPELMQLLDRLQRRAQHKLESVRIVPRMHKILNIK